jgi:hypothetical protein
MLRYGAQQDLEPDQLMAGIRSNPHAYAQPGFLGVNQEGPIPRHRFPIVHDAGRTGHLEYLGDFHTAGREDPFEDRRSTPSGDAPLPASSLVRADTGVDYSIDVGVPHELVDQPEAVAPDQFQVILLDDIPEIDDPVRLTALQVLEAVNPPL